MADTQTRTAALQILFGGRLQGVVRQRTLVAGYWRFGTARLATEAIRDGCKMLRRNNKTTPHIARHGL